MFQNFESRMHTYYNFVIKYKNESLFMKIIGLLLFFNKDFMTKYITTIGNTIYFPNEQFIKENELNSISILAHEIVHLQQSKKYGNFLYSLLYLFPQCLFILALLAPISNWFLLFLVCLFPLPAPWRAKFEEEGYTMSLFVIDVELKAFRNKQEYIHNTLIKTAENIDKIFFRGSAYWFMWPFGSNLLEKVEDIENDVISNTNELYKIVKPACIASIGKI